MVSNITALLCYLAITQVLGWEALPAIPTGRRAQFYLQNENGGYKYGYDTGDGIAAKQSADLNNQVEGHYFYKDKTGENFDLKYTSGVQGFVPEGLEKLQGSVRAVSVPIFPTIPIVPTYPVHTYSSHSEDDQVDTGDASYKFYIDTDTYKRTEASDAKGNVQGSYSYSDGAGHYDLKYVAGSNTGFVATSGSLSIPNGLDPTLLKSAPFASQFTSVPSFKTPTSNNDGSYSFEYATDAHSRKEQADAQGNVHGRYSFKNAAGNHDLSFVAGSDTGFLVTGGSLSQPNGLTSSVSSQPAFLEPSFKHYETSSSTSSSPSSDGSYSFQYSTSDQSRNEQSDTNGHVHGGYSYRNADGNHDLSYVAGSGTGFVVTGGSLSQPNGLSASVSSSAVVPSPSFKHAEAISTHNSLPSSDGSYSFQYSTNDHSRKEQSDVSGNVHGAYSYKNAAGIHDLSYVAGSNTGFLVTGGSLATPNGLPSSSVLAKTYPIVPSLPNSDYVNSHSTDESGDDQSNTGDGSYNFSIDTDEYKRHESSDANGNVQGSYSYKNLAGFHDLSFIAGENTGFLPTSGSLIASNSGVSGNEPLTKSALPSSDSIETYSSDNSDDSDNSSDQSNTGDASYNFSIDTDEYKRHESSDANGNVRGSFAYKNNVGSHDLSFVAGSSTGFLPTGGSLKAAPGLSEPQLNAGYQQFKSSVVP